MKKWILSILIMGFFSGLCVAQAETSSTPKKTWQQRRLVLKERQQQIKKLVRQYKHASEAEKPAIKSQVEELVSARVDEGFSYMKEHIAQERTRLDNWEAKLKADEANSAQLKAQQVEDLLTGSAKKKYKQAKKAWKRQLKAQRKKML